MRSFAALLAVGVLLGALAFVATSSRANAHASFLRSQPAEGAVLSEPPVEILIWFTENIEVDFSDARLIDVTGQRFDNKDFHVHSDPANPGLTAADLPDGVYTVIWDVLSAVDGHRTKGAFAFTIGTPPAGGTAPSPQVPIGQGSTSTPPRSLEVAVRWLNFAAMAAIIGAAAFPFLVLPPAFSAVQGKQGSDEAARRTARWLAFSLVVGSLALVGATLASLWIQAWAAAGSTLSLNAIGDVLSGTRFGDVWI
ncbi:MAG: copper resistance CopC family protein, partial [Gammaproteobacteria bacterium]